MLPRDSGIRCGLLNRVVAEESSRGNQDPASTARSGRRGSIRQDGEEAIPSTSAMHASSCSSIRTQPARSQEAGGGLETEELSSEVVEGQGWIVGCSTQVSTWGGAALKASVGVSVLLGGLGSRPSRRLLPKGCRLYETSQVALPKARGAHSKSLQVATLGLGRASGLHGQLQPLAW